MQLGGGGGVSKQQASKCPALTCPWAEPRIINTKTEGNSMFCGPETVNIEKKLNIV